MTRRMEAACRATIENLPDLTRALADEPSLRQVAEALRAGDSGTIDGAWGSSKTLALAALAAHRPPLLVVVLPHPREVDAFVDDLSSFASREPIVFPAVEDPATTLRKVGRDGMGQTADLRDEDSLTASPDASGRRLALLKALAGLELATIVVTTIQGLLQPVPTPSKVRGNSRQLRVGATLDREELLRWLVALGWTRRDAVEAPGEFSARGGIIDLFPPDRDDPIRLELFGDEIESLREFACDSQRSLRELAEVEITGLGGDLGAGDVCHFAAWTPPGTWFALVEPDELGHEARQYLNRLEDERAVYSVHDCWAELLRHPTVIVSSFPTRSMETTCTLHVESVERFSGDLKKVRAEIDGTVLSDQLLLVCHNEAELARLGEVFKESRTAREGRLALSVGRLSAGFRWITAGVVAISDNELFRRQEVRRAAPRRQLHKAIDSFLELRGGDYVVHLAHGIAIFRGMKMLEKCGQTEEHLILEFADCVLVYVPVSKIDLVQRYVGASQTAPRLSRVGGLLWERRKRQVQESVTDLATELLDLQAVRAAQPGIAYPADSEWQRQFVASFPYVETPDQLATADEIRVDMEQPRPMDRLICGDVGYGKTELAMRGAFKAVDAGRQVAVLVPTTVLAQQHLRTFRARMAEFPFVVECLSRFESKAQQRRIVDDLANGSVDVVVGTHRLLSPDVVFHDLGLVIIDEEQRFGVAHKEQLKRVRRQVDVLTMTATPIPRTLHGALLGIRDISNLETPPSDRLAVETRISRFDPALIRHAVLRELNREGQVYFVHNRVHDIGRVADRLTQIVPEATVAIIHGQMPEEQIEDGMIRFLERRADILLATTIIESGLDIPNANTIFINDADRYGLADLHQLRGRVGRSQARAYCYILVDENKIIKPDAQRRLKAIEEYSTLGAGFQIALRDLEIRGAGNILGAEQSGHIAAVGYELYCQLLENSVRALKNLPIESHLDVTVELPWKAYLPVEYLPGERYRIDAYRRMARVRNLNELAEFRRELSDRFGAPPEPAANLLELAQLRILAQHWQIESIRLDDHGYLTLAYRDLRRVERLASKSKGDVVVADGKTAVVRVPPAERNAVALCRRLKRLLQPA